MKFEDLLNRPLPSQTFTESPDEVVDDNDMEEGFDNENDDFDLDTEEGCGSGAECGYRNEESDEEDEDDDYLDDLDDELDNDEDFDYGDDEDDDYDDEDEPEDEDECAELEEKPAAPLTGEADVQADNMMAMAATPMLIRDELSAEESVAFFNSSEAEIAVSEGFLTESDIDDVFDEDVYEEGVFANPNKPFKMTKAARFKQLYELSLQIEARQHKDPKYKTLQKAYSVERKIKKDWRKKYHTLALKRAKKYLKKLMTSKSPILNSIGKKLGFKK